ncbi:MAG: membrane protein insertase YidC [Betaproteobacteria bacterium]|nr:membrane protein insertase YidC [Betaproteobacteria bacterium]
MDTQRLILFFVFSFSLLLLWDAWEKQKQPKPAAVAASVPAVPTGSATPGTPSPTVPSGVPVPAKPAATAVTAAPAVPTAAAEQARGERIIVRTDLYVAEIDTLGGTLKRLELLKHKDSKDEKKNFVLLGPEQVYEAQSGLAGDFGANHRTLWQGQAGERSLGAGEASLQVRLSAAGRDGLTVDKVYTFRRDTYVVDVAFELKNGGSAAVSPYAYFQLTHNGKPQDNTNSVAQSFGAQSFTGFAEYTGEKKFEKIDFSDVDKGKPSHVRQSKDGWLAFVQHYFVSAWLPVGDAQRDFAVEKRADGAYVGRILTPLPVIAPGATATVSAQLYAGPQEQRRLKDVAPGFDLVVDYGWLTIIAWPLFWVLEKSYEISGNWGVAIILLTVLIKLLFFPLSAASYRSMAKMKVITPRLTKLREMYGNDRVKMNQAMMDLYKTEKINPLGGCFPIVVQIPVFIALYWVLLAAIELRHAPFVLWIRDLSALDPYYVLPVLMTLTMIIQTRLNPVPPDPVQAKVMQIMPFVFSVFFFFFPAGLVLYWLVNNILSILQQWQIQRMFDRDKPAHAKR